MYMCMYIHTETEMGQCEKKLEAGESKRGL